VSSTWEEDFKGLRNATLISADLGRSIAHLLAERYRQKRIYEQDETTSDPDSKQLSKIAVYMADMPPEVAEAFTIELILFLDSLINSIGFVMAEQNRQILRVVRDLPPEQG